ncbi:MAG: hypothetical protein N2379_04490 [Verrucomicrobiae bacterium]|nr:hypothetical protein [Verrucomicrobiae bacterium]
MNKKLELLSIFFWIMGGLHIAGAGLFVVVGVLGSLGLINPEDTLQERITGGVGAGIIAVCGSLFGASHIIVGTALRRLQPWARTAGIVLAILDILLCCCNWLLGIPFGIYALVVLLNQETTQLFDARQ